MGDDQLDVPLEDVELLAEVELTTDLMIAASEVDQQLSQSTVDDLLGLGDARDARDDERPLDVRRQDRYSA